MEAGNAIDVFAFQIKGGDNSALIFFYCPSPPPVPLLTSHIPAVFRHCNKETAFFIISRPGLESWAAT